MTRGQITRKIEELGYTVTRSENWKVFTATKDGNEVKASTPMGLWKIINTKQNNPEINKNTPL